MEAISNLFTENILKYFTSARFFLTLAAVTITVALVIILGKVFSYYLKKQKEINNGNMDAERTTLLHVIASILSGVIILIAIIFILQINGVQVSSLITSVSIISAIVGLALQDTIKDIIQGIQILSDRFFMVGDVVRFDDHVGVVTKFTMRSTKIKTLKTQNEITVANRNLTKIEKQNETQFMTVPVPYDEPVERMFRIFPEIAQKMNQEEGITNARFLGLNELADSSMKYLMAFECNPLYMLRHRRQALKVIVEGLAVEGISIPFNQLDVHFDNDTKGAIL